MSVVVATESYNKPIKSLRLSSIVKNNIVQMLLGDHLTMDKVENIPVTHLRDELIELYEVRFILNGLQQGTLSLDDASYILQIHDADPLILRDMYPSVPKSLRNDLVKVYRFINAMNDFRDGNITLDQLNGMLRIGLTDDVELDKLYPFVPESLRYELVKVYWFDDAFEILDTRLGDFEEAIRILQNARSTSDPVLPLDELFPYVPETWKHELFNRFVDLFSHMHPEEVIGILDRWLHVDDIDAMAIDIVSSPYQLMLDHLSSLYIEGREMMVASLTEQLENGLLAGIERDIEIDRVEQEVQLSHEFYSEQMKRELNRWIDGDAAVCAEYLKTNFNILQPKEKIIKRMRLKFRLATGRMSLYFYLDNEN